MPNRSAHCKAHTALRNIIVTTILLTIAACTTAPKTPIPAVAKLAATLPPAYLQATVGLPLSALPRWKDDNVLEAWGALLRSCQRMGNKPPWQAFCRAASPAPSTEAAARKLLEDYLVAYPQENNQGKNTGIATAYFEPVYAASLQPNKRYSWALYAAPEPMTTLSRNQLTPANAPVNPLLIGKELAYLDNPIDAFLAQIQGSVRLQMEDGSTKRLGFAAKNGLPYQSIANTLIAQGVFTANQASMARIKAWTLDKNTAEIQTVLNNNPSFVFFRWLNLADDLGAIGAVGVSISPMRSVAADAAYTPLGAPIWLETQTLNGAFNQLMLAQDVGSAIKGAARVDIYMGTGEAAGQLASAQKYPAKVWVLLPKP